MIKKTKTSIYKFKNEAGIDKKYWNKKWWYYSEKIPYFGIYYSIAQWATLACYKLLNAEVGIFSP